MNRTVEGTGLVYVCPVGYIDIGNSTIAPGDVIRMIDGELREIKEGSDWVGKFVRQVFNSRPVFRKQ